VGGPSRGKRNDLDTSGDYLYLRIKVSKEKSAEKGGAKMLLLYELPSTGEGGGSFRLEACEKESGISVG